jgi:hypothetical protein
VMDVIVESRCRDSRYGIQCKLVVLVHNCRTGYERRRRRNRNLNRNSHRRSLIHIYLTSRQRCSLYRCPLEFHRSIDTVCVLLLQRRAESWRRSVLIVVGNNIQISRRIDDRYREECTSCCGYSTPSRD